MIPFNHLGFIFSKVAKDIYPPEIKGELEKILKDKSNLNILDIGAGTGALSDFVYEINPNSKFICVDPAFGMLKYAPNYTFKVVGVAENLPVKSDSIDLILIGEAIHHFRDVDKSLVEIKRVLKKDGILFLFDFDVSQLKGKMIKFFEKLFGEPGNFFEPDDLSSILQKDGFETRITKYGYKFTITAFKEGKE